MVCAECGEDFPSWVTIDGKPRNLTNRKRCLRCSPFGAHRNTKVGGSTAKPRGKYQDVKAYRHRLKAKAVAYKGGACLLCGYCKTTWALEFHHVDPGEKDFSLAANTNKAWEFIKAELDKCALLCANCHREVHAGISTVPVIG